VYKSLSFASECCLLSRSTKRNTLTLCRFALALSLPSQRSVALREKKSRHSFIVSNSVIHRAGESQRIVHVAALNCVVNTDFLRRSPYSEPA
jgi:hypothetical protein